MIDYIADFFKLTNSCSNWNRCRGLFLFASSL